MNSNYKVKNHLFLIVYLLCPFFYGLLVYWIKVNLNVYQMESFYFYYGNFSFLFTSFITGLFLFFMMLLYLQILRMYRYGKAIGLIGAGILPILWMINILIASVPDLKNPFCLFMLKSMGFLYRDNDILSAFLILISLLIIYNFFPLKKYK